MTYTGQLMGGPDHGNLVEAGGTRIKYIDRLVCVLDPAGPETRVRARYGNYNWNRAMGVFVWTGWDDEADIQRLKLENEWLQRQLNSVAEELRESRRAAQGSDRVF